jgi:hypothetical protein
MNDTGRPRPTEALSLEERNGVHVFTSEHERLGDTPLILFLRKGATHSISAGWIYGRIALFNVSDDTFLVHDKGSASGKALFFIVDAVGF